MQSSSNVTNQLGVNCLYGEKLDPRFAWTGFYEALADGLLKFKARRAELMAKIHVFAKNLNFMSALNDKFSDGTQGPLQDICPFTVFALFNRHLTDENRRTVAASLAKIIGVTEEIPPGFDAVPIVNNQRTWFFSYEKDRAPDDIDALWEVFEQSLRLSSLDTESNTAAFRIAFERASAVRGVGLNLTMGLFWIRPWSFPPLDKCTRKYLTSTLKRQVVLSGPKNQCAANDYLSLRSTLEDDFRDTSCPVHSFPELSLSAWGQRSVPPEPTESIPSAAGFDDSEQVPPQGEVVIEAPCIPYSIDDILADGCFLSRDRVQFIVSRLRAKQNLILQGPPGTGKTWLARKLAFALMGERSEGRLFAVQFHPNMSYEDFVRGWRPSGDGKLSLSEGAFLVAAKAAAQDPGHAYVMLIEEINRGRPAQIFGELLTLLEADKRNAGAALELCYPRNVGERFYVPPNLFIIGTMNIADRSLALVDLALRRRFAFIDLVPSFGEPWRQYVHKHLNIEPELLQSLEQRILSLNNTIAGDARLGPQFQIGHSYFTPQTGVTIPDALNWFREVVHTEIRPLLEEYWFDAREQAEGD